MRQKPFYIILLSSWLFLFACGGSAEVVPPTAQAVPTLGEPTQAALATVASAEPTAIPEEIVVEPTVAIVEPTAVPEPTALPIIDNPFGAPLTDGASQETLRALQAAGFSSFDRDDIELAIGFKNAEPVSADNMPTADPITVGTVQEFSVSNIDDNTINFINAEMMYASETAYFWFDQGDGGAQPTQERLEAVGVEFDLIYATVTHYFGNEANPGIDGDPKVHVLNASPLALCNVTLSSQGQCGIAGYFSPVNVLPKSIANNSNEREMFVMNASIWQVPYYISVLGHEFRHMVEENHDSSGSDWEVEGSAMLAETLLGYESNSASRGNSFLNNPSQQLNSWTDGNTLPYYGMGYLMNQYVFTRFGEDVYRQFATSPANGIAAVEEITTGIGQPVTSTQFFLDWLATLLLHNEAEVADPYLLGGPAVDRVDLSSLTAFNFPVEETIPQFAGHFYEISSNVEYLNFAGKTAVPIVASAASSGRGMWYANRINQSNVKLTREFDLTNVQTATLTYDVFYDIELGYDFAYVSVSTDGGTRWQPLVADGMNGLLTEDNPADNAYADRFYTGVSDGWKSERVNLTPYVGQPILLRFQYVTDSILTFDGIAIDNIAIPEIGFVDDGESADSAWMAEGFTRITDQMPQPWHLQLITFDQFNVPTVHPLTVTETATATIDLTAYPSSRPHLLIIAATAPMTLQPTEYIIEKG